MERDDLVFKAKLAEQAERCADRRVVLREGGFRKHFFFFFLVWCPASVADFVRSQLTFQRESQSRESLFIYFFTL
jgi:hypothetical protein